MDNVFLIVVLIGILFIFYLAIIELRVSSYIKYGTKLTLDKRLKRIQLLTKLYIIGMPRIKGYLYNETGSIYLQKQQFETAIAYFEKTIKRCSNSIILADTYIKLSECYTSLDQLEKAEESINLSVSIIQTSIKKIPILLLLAEMMEKIQKYEQACLTYQAGLSLIKSQTDSTAIQLKKLLANACINSSQYRESLKTALPLIDSVHTNTDKRLVHLIAGYAYMGLMDYRKAEMHFYDYLDLAEDTKQKATGLTYLSMLYRYQGSIERAIELSNEAISLDQKNDRSYLELCETYIQAGKFEEAKEVIQHRKHRGWDRIACGYTLYMAKIEAYSGNTSRAWSHICSVQAGYKNLTSMKSNVQAHQAWILALIGDIDKSNHYTELCIKNMEILGNKPYMMRWSYPWLTLAAIQCKQYDKAQQYLDLTMKYLLEPLYQPAAQFVQGEIYRGLCRADDACKAYQAAVNTNIATYYTKLASERLDEMHLH